MIEKPDIPDEMIRWALEACYAIQADSLEFVPHGLDCSTWAYQVRSGAAVFFLKGSRGSLNPTGAWVPRFLAEQGLQQVIAPLPAKDGAVQGTAAGLNLRLQPFVAAESAMASGMSPEKWKELGEFLGQLHRLGLPDHATTRLRRESYVPRRLEWVTEMNARVDAIQSADAIVAEMIAAWRGNRERVSELIERTRMLVRQAPQRQRPMVLCHADIHTANILLTAGGRMYVVDWEDAMLAPKERDLMFVLAEADGSERESFLTGYGADAIDPLALAYYQHDWCIEDMGAFAEEILDLEGTGDASRANSLSWFKHLFAAGSSVPTALANDFDRTKAPTAAADMEWGQ